MRKLYSLIFFTLMSLPLFAESSKGIENAANENKYLYIFFYKDQNEKTNHLQTIFDKAAEQLGEQAKFLKVQASDPSEKPLIDRFNLKRAPMPFVIVLAPNGAVMGGFPSFTQQQLIDSLSSSGAASCLKALQEKKLALICLQNSQTKENEAALKAVNEFKADTRFKNGTEIIMIDPSDVKEQKFLNQLNLNTQSSQAITTLISPPSQIIGTYHGAVTKAQLVSDVEKATSQPCCPGGCCPGGKCGNK